MGNVLMFACSAYFRWVTRFANLSLQPIKCFRGFVSQSGKKSRLEQNNQVFMDKSPIIYRQSTYFEDMIEKNLDHY